MKEAVQVGRRGFANKTFPLHQSVLLDGAILLSHAFASKGERDCALNLLEWTTLSEVGGGRWVGGEPRFLEFSGRHPFQSVGHEDAVPQWRDGQLGRDLQRCMVNSLACRLFEYGCLDQVVQNNESAFATGSHWTSFARLVGPPQLHMKNALERLFDAECGWPDSVRALYRAVWVGDHDVELCKLGSLFPANLDTQPVQLQKKLMELFSPILTLMQQKESEAARLQTSAEKEAEKAKKAKEEELKQSEQSSQSKPSDPSSTLSVNDGDVTDDLFKDQDSIGKRNLCDALNKDAKKRQATALDEQLYKAAAEVLRSRLVVVDSTASAKSYMESCSSDGLRTRVAFVDWTQFSSLQSTGLWTKVLSTKPTKEFQKKVSDELMMLPFVAINGCILIRAGQQPIDHFNAELSDSFPFPRPIFVPIDLPPVYARAVKSAARRALGPSADAQERSGVVFTMRCIGARTHDTGNEEGEGRQGEDMSEDEDEFAQADGEEYSGDVPLEAMNTQQLRKQFGRSALDVVGAMFQHQSKIGESARFMSRTGSHTEASIDGCGGDSGGDRPCLSFWWSIACLITTTGTRCTSCFGPTIRTDSINYVTDSGRKATLRRSQVHPTVVYSALKSTLATSAMGLTPNDCFVQVGGGTPEGIVAAIMLGFQKVFYIGNEKERQWMSLPSKAVELSSAIDYLNYTSPDPDFPEKGILVVEAIKMLMPCIKSFVMEEIGSVMVPPPA